MTYNTWLVMVGACCAACIPRVCVKYYIKICSTSICLVACWRLIYIPIFSIVAFVIIVGNFVNKHECKYTSYTKLRIGTLQKIFHVEWSSKVGYCSVGNLHCSQYIVYVENHPFLSCKQQSPNIYRCLSKKLLKWSFIMFNVLQCFQIHLDTYMPRQFLSVW